MKYGRKLIGMLLILALLTVLGGAAAFAAEPDAETAETEAVEETSEPAEAEETSEPAEAEETAEAEEPDPEAEPEAEEAPSVPLVCAAGETMSVSEGEVICAEGGTVYNNGAVVFNNGGTVFNNRGVCYNNAGVCYNNEGTVYLNGGRAFNNAGEAYCNGGELFDRTLPVAEPVEEEAAAPVEEEAAEPVEEETAAPVEEEAAEPVEEETAAPVEEEAAEPVEEETAEPVEEEAVEEEPAGPSYVLSAPLFEPVAAGYPRTELPTAAASLKNTGTEPIVIKAARINGKSADCFIVSYEKNVTVAPGETNDTAWVVSLKASMPVGEYEARLVLILENGDLIQAPFTLKVVKP